MVHLNCCNALNAMKKAREQHMLNMLDVIQKDMCKWDAVITRIFWRC